MKIVELEGVCKQYHRHRAVDGVSFFVKKGEIFGLVGESGSGKTTVGRMIMGLCEPSEGRVTFYNDTQGEAAAKGGVQMVFQDPYSSLDGTKTVFSIVSQGLYLRGERNKEGLFNAAVEALEAVGLPREYAGRYPRQLSGGQRQRVAIARCIIMKPRLLIADEPISALDASAQRQILSLLSSLCKRMGMASVFITHDLGAARSLCHRVGVMCKGRLVEIAPTRELFANAVNPYTKNLLDAVLVADPIYQKSKSSTVKNTQKWEGELQSVGKEHYAILPAK